MWWTQTNMVRDGNVATTCSTPRGIYAIMHWKLTLKVTIMLNDSYVDVIDEWEIQISNKCLYRRSASVAAGKSRSSFTPRWNSQTRQRRIQERAASKKSPFLHPLPYRFSFIVLGRAGRQKSSHLWLTLDRISWERLAVQPLPTCLRKIQCLWYCSIATFGSRVLKTWRYSSKAFVPCWTYRENCVSPRKESMEL